MVDILLVEDNKELSKLMSTFLVKDGYSVFCAMSGEEAESFFAKDNTRLVILDIMLPGMDGFAVCSFIRKKGEIPIIIISAVVDKEIQNEWILSLEQTITWKNRLISIY